VFGWLLTRKQYYYSQNSVILHHPNTLSTNFSARTQTHKQRVRGGGGDWRSWTDVKSWEPWEERKRIVRRDEGGRQRGPIWKEPRRHSKKQCWCRKRWHQRLTSELPAMTWCPSGPLRTLACIRAIDLSIDLLRQRREKGRHENSIPAGIIGSFFASASIRGHMSKHADSEGKRERPLELTSPAKLKKFRIYCFFYLYGQIIYQRFWFNSNKQLCTSKFVFKLTHSRYNFSEPLLFFCGDLHKKILRWEYESESALVNVKTFRTQMLLEKLYFCLIFSPIDLWLSLTSRLGYLLLVRIVFQSNPIKNKYYTYIFILKNLTQICLFSKYRCLQFNLSIQRNRDLQMRLRSNKKINKFFKHLWTLESRLQNPNTSVQI
jgi:hypothetical protein